MDYAGSKNPNKPPKNIPQNKLDFQFYSNIFKKDHHSFFVVVQAQPMKFCRYIFIRCWGTANLVLYFK